MLRFAVAAVLSSLLLAASAASAAPVPTMVPMARPPMAAPWQMKKVPKNLWRPGTGLVTTGKVVPSTATADVPTCNPIDAILGKTHPVTKVPRRPGICQILNHY